METSLGLGHLYVQLNSMNFKILEEKDLANYPLENQHVLKRERIVSQVAFFRGKLQVFGGITQPKIYRLFINIDPLP